MPARLRMRVSTRTSRRTCLSRHEQGRDRFGSMFAEGFRHRTLGPSSVHRRRGSELRDWVMRSLWGLAAVAARRSAGGGCSALCGCAGECDAAACQDVSE